MTPDRDTAWPICIRVPDPALLEGIRHRRRKAGDPPGTTVKSRTELFLAAIELRLDGDDRRAGALLHEISKESDEIGDAAFVEYALLHYKEADLGQISFRLREILSRGDGSMLAARAHHALGMKHYSTLDFSRACKELSEAEWLFNRLGSTAGAGQAADSLGNVLARLGKLDLAGAAIARSLVAKSRIGDFRGIAISAGALGRLLGTMGRHREAAWCFQQDLALMDSESDPATAAMLHGMRGQSFWKAGEQASARREFEIAAQHAVRSRSASAIANARADFLLHDSAPGDVRLEFPGDGQLHEHSRIRLALGELVAFRLPDSPSWREEMVRLADAARAAGQGLADIEVDVLVRLHQLASGCVDEDTALSWLSRAHVRAIDGSLVDARHQIETLMLSKHARTPLSTIPTASITSSPDGTPVIEDFLIGKPLGGGGFGTAYEAYDLRRGEKVALKVFGTRQAGDSAIPLLESARTEVMASASVPAPFLAKTHAVGMDARSRIYVVAELVVGKTLAEALDRGELAGSARLRAQIALGLLQAIRHLHSHGIVHRDIKPANIMLRVPGYDVTLIDLGTARIEGVLESALDGFATSRYAPPECNTTGAVADESADWYACGVILAEIFASKSITARSTLHRRRDSFLRLLGRKPKSSLDGILARMASGSPSKRIEAARDAIAYLHAFLGSN